MKLYIASSFDLVGKVEMVAEALERRGHTILVRWWSSDGFNMWDKKQDYTSRQFYHDPLCAAIFDKDFNGVKDADAFILVGGDAPMPLTGANVELGLAIAFNKPCYSVGALKNSAMYWPVLKCDSLQELVDALEDV